MTVASRTPARCRIEEALPRKLQYRLVRKRPNPKTNLRKVSSSSDGIIDLAAAVELGLVPAVGLYGILHSQLQRQARKLLKTHTLTLSRAKYATRLGNHNSQLTRRQAHEALPTVIGPYYWEVFGCSPSNALRTAKIAKWISKEVSEPDSELNRRLAVKKFDSLHELRRGWRWWFDLLNG